MFMSNPSSAYKKRHRLTTALKAHPNHSLTIIDLCGSFFKALFRFQKCQNEKWKSILAGPEATRMTKTIGCVYPESVPARHGGVAALAASKVHQVDLAGDAVLVLLSLNQFRLSKIKEEIKLENLKLQICCRVVSVLKLQTLISKKGQKKKNPYLCLGHDESEHGVRSGALVIHPRGSCGTLLVSKV